MHLCSYGIVIELSVEKFITFYHLLSKYISGKFVIILYGSVGLAGNFTFHYSKSPIVSHSEDKIGNINSIFYEKKYLRLNFFFNRKNRCVKNYICLVVYKGVRIEIC